MFEQLSLWLAWLCMYSRSALCSISTTTTPWARRRTRSSPAKMEQTQTCVRRGVFFMELQNVFFCGVLMYYGCYAWRRLPCIELAPDPPLSNARKVVDHRLDIPNITGRLSRSKQHFPATVLFFLTPYTHYPSPFKIGRYLYLIEDIYKFLVW